MQSSWQVDTLSSQQEKFSIVWNHKIIENGYRLSEKEENITMCNVKKKCQEEDTTPMNFRFKTDVYPSEFTWNVIDLDGTIKYSGGNYTQPFTDYFFGLVCIPYVENECLTFQAFDSAKNGGTLYQLQYGNGTEFHYGNAYKEVTKVPFPNSECRCPQGESLFELDLYIRDRSIQFSWELITANASIVTSGSQYITWNHKYKHRECLPAIKASDCLALSFYVHDDVYGEVDYSVRLDGNLIRSSQTAKKLRDTVVINGNCSFFPICAEGFKSIKIVMYTIDCQNNSSCPFSWSNVESYPEPFSWEIVDPKNNMTLMNGGKNTREKQRFYHYRKCVPSDGSWSFRFLESLYSGGVIVYYYDDFKYEEKKAANGTIVRMSYNDPIE